MSNTAIILFDISSVAGLVLLTAVFLTAWGSSGAARTPTWFTFIGSLIVLSGTNILIMGEQTGPEPTKWACFLQAVLIYPEVVFNAHAGAALLVQVYLSMLSIERSRILPRKYVTWLVVCPIASTFAILVLSTVMAAINPSVVRRDISGMRCHLEQVPQIVFYTSVAVGILGVAIIFVFEVLVISKFLRNRQALKEGMIQGRTAPAMILRLTLFNVLIFIVVIISVFVFKDAEASLAANNLAMATLPLGGAIIFGTQKDILGVWASLLAIKSRSKVASPV
ncbi:hypothetical protein D9613_003517 [Agrocybe pediades]|uniref:Uncharacterized protein n=1 Tax=Agrocybe pediades TaxID=84607 RepID=A0A8H4QRA4_9AGAR|nr:hypothetical protein D9613_003517 [Agrocybe pediades]